MLTARNYLYRFQLHHIATQIFFISNRSTNTKDFKSMRIYFSLLQQFCNAVSLRWIIYDWLIHMFGITLWWSIYILIDPSNFLHIIHLYSVYYHHLRPLESQRAKSDLVTEYVCVFIYIKDMISFSCSCVGHLLIIDIVSNEVTINIKTQI